MLCTGVLFCVAICVESNLGAVEWIRTTTVLLPPAPQAGASASSATTARANAAHLFTGETFVRDSDYQRVSRRRQYPRLVSRDSVHLTRSRDARLLVYLDQKVSRSASRRFSALASNSTRSLPMSRRS